jgi:hypothetical protein
MRIMIVRSAIVQPAERSVFKANSALARGDLESALLHLRTAARLSPDVAAAHNDIGCVLTKGGTPEQAGASFERALALDAGHMPARRNFVRWTAASKGPSRALRMLTSEMSGAAADGWIYFEAAVLRAQIDQSNTGEQTIRIHGTVLIWRCCGTPDYVAAFLALLLQARRRVSCSSRHGCALRRRSACTRRLRRCAATHSEPSGSRGERCVVPPPTGIVFPPRSAARPNCDRSRANRTTPMHSCSSRPRCTTSETRVRRSARSRRR